ncbi:hypothetical protein BJ912DRAFT_706669 [Pholiota molesta]|nr:hypothetical protein BJ912DRAFT_706669 [Pholiota molesta]
MFKTGSHAYWPNKTPSQPATPTRTETASHPLEGVGNRKASFADDVMKRDGFTCVVTSMQDLEHPEPNEDIEQSTLHAAHILRRAIGQFDSDHNSDSYKSALTTFDILVTFTRLPAKTLEELREELDHPSNGITLAMNAHAAFDRFDWCLVKTEKEDVYAVKIYSKRNRAHVKNTTHVTFEDHGNDFSSSANKLKRSAPIDLPNPRYIEIHAAIAGILNMSGAGKFFDELLRKYDEGKVAAVRFWPEFEALMEAEILREYVFQAFQSVNNGFL